LWKNFDARNVEYVQKLSEKHQLPVAIVQVSSSVNQKEMTKALDMCEALGTTTITINAPTMFNYKSYSYLTDVLPRLREDYPHIRFSIINPEDASLFALPIPQYRFSNLAEIVKKHHCYLALDVANMNSATLEDDMMRKLKDFVPYLSTVYISDKSRTGVSHLIPGEGVLKLNSLLGKLQSNGYSRYFSSKITFSKSDLSDGEKILALLKEVRKFYNEAIA
jgi:sugar phosphate isomerase/epimerase